MRGKKGKECVVDIVYIAVHYEYYFIGNVFNGVIVANAFLYYSRATTVQPCIYAHIYVLFINLYIKTSM